MKADLSRLTFSSAKHIHDLRLQQGRVQLEADWNEQIDIAAHRVEIETIDVVGPCGAPVGDAAFMMTNSVSTLPAAQQAAATALGPLVAGDFYLSAGRFYAHGILCENDSPVKFSGQPDLPNCNPITTKGLYLVYLDVWQRLLTYLDDPSMREVALNGPDTAVRLKTIWQVKLINVGATGATPDCAADYPPYDHQIAGPTGMLSASVEPGGTSNTPCIIAPGAGYRSLENQLYRVEVHQGGSDGTATFKWSRDDGAVVFQWKSTTTANIIQLLQTPPDNELGFAVGQWVEITDDNNDLDGTPGMLVKITHVDTLNLTLGSGALPQPLSNFTLNPKVRRWDSVNSAATAGDIAITTGAPISLEHGVQVAFSAGTYNSGDYWLIPARTATANVEWLTDSSGNPVPSLPQGIKHLYCQLGFVDFNGTTITPTDCRSLFPPLTAVQSGCDLKLHNQHLHGWGVVCGLQVHCASDFRRKLVTVEPGHAILCDGTDVLLKSAQDIDVVSQASALKLLDATGAGSVSIQLTADNNNQPVLTVVAPPASSTESAIQQILNGTLWMDFYNDCLQPYIKGFQAEFGADATDTKLVPDSKRRLTATTNLFYQLTNAAGKNVWLSGKEHTLLQGIYNDLSKVLGSNTFCAIKDNLTPFPSYPFEKQNITTAFGNSPMVGARISPDGATVIAFDNGATGNFYLFAASSGEMTAALNVNTSTPLTVRDVLFFGKAAKPQLLVAATGNGNTTLAIFDLNSRNLVSSQTFSGLELTRLETSPYNQTYVLAIVVGKGLFRLNPASIHANALTNPLLKFNAAGHLAVSGDFVAATDAGNGTAPAYTGVRVGYVNSDGALLELVPLLESDHKTQIQGADGITFVPNTTEAGDSSPTLYVGVNAAATDATNHKRILAIESLKRVIISYLDSQTTGAVALSTDGQVLLLGLANECQLTWVNPRQNTVDLVANFLPSQIMPVAFASSAGSLSQTPASGKAPKNFTNEKRTFPVIAVNRISQTLTVIPSNLVGVTPAPVTVAALDDYRAAMIAAFKDLLFRIIQGLKDCLCDRLLLDCPTCGPNDVIYLATIEIKDSKVYHICNFVRQDVLTFPKVKYWLSAVPVVPVIHWLVQKFCCGVLPEVTKTINAAGYFNMMTSAALAEKIQTKNFNFNLSDMAARYTAVGKFAAQAAFTRAILPQNPTLQKVMPTGLLQANPDTAAFELANQGVTVASVSDVSLAITSNLPLIDASAMPINLQAGDHVNLYTQNGRVVYYTRTTPAPASAPAAGTTAASTAGTVDIQSLQQELGAMRTQVASLQEAHTEALKQIAKLKTTTTTLQTKIARSSKG